MPRKKLRVFVVDDEHNIAYSLATILRLQGFDAVFFTEPLEALNAARSSPPDLLISDVVMPLVSGVELGIQMKAACPKLKVLLFSGQPSAANLLSGAKTRGHDFELLIKPLHPEELVKKIRSVIYFPTPEGEASV